MDARVKHKAKESTTIIAAKFEDDLMKNMKKPVVSIIGQEADDVEDTCNNRELTRKILELEDDVSRPNSSDQDDDSKKDHLRSSSISLEMINKLENDENTTQKTENIKKEEEKTKEKEGNEIIGNMMKNNKKTTTIPHVWDCGSTLYDSFELNSFKRQLDSAISASSARTMSMSHIPNRSLPLTLSPEHTYTPPLDSTSSSSSNSSGGKKQSNKISRSLQRLLKSVFFRPKNPKSLSSRSTPTSPVYNYKAAGQRGDKDRYYVVYDKTGSLTTIPESTSEKEVVSPEINSLVRKTVSERFPASRVVGISCA